MKQAQEFGWQTISALNAVSALSQVGQFGIAFVVLPVWLAEQGTLAGFGLGLRWIGVEPWLHPIAPADARGRLVGFHESLITLAPIVATLRELVFKQGVAIALLGGMMEAAVSGLFALLLKAARYPSAKSPTYAAAELRPVHGRGVPARRIHHGVSYPCHHCLHHDGIRRHGQECQHDFHAH